MAIVMIIVLAIVPVMTHVILWLLFYLYWFQWWFRILPYVISYYGLYLSRYDYYMFCNSDSICLDYCGMRQRYIDEGFLVWIIPSMY